MAIQKITSGILADGAIVAADIANGSITTAKIADGNVTSAKIDTVANTKITGLVTSGQIANVANTQITGSIEATQVGTTVSQLFGMRNRIINGAMEIDQRNAGASVTVSASGVASVDRFTGYCQQATGAFTMQQSTTVPTLTSGAFTNSLLFTVTNTTAPGSTNRVLLRQIIEGLNVADFGWGTSSATTITLSFWVRSSIIGTYGVGFINSAENRSYVGTYTINSANTWEQKSITVAGDTTGTWLTNNSNGIRVAFDLGSGTGYNASSANTWVAQEACRTSSCVNWQQNSGATFYITGVQLELGSSATPFERRQYGQELALCQRYFQTVANGPSGASNLTTSCLFGFQFPVVMRTAPSSAVTGAIRVSDISTSAFTQSSGTISNNLVTPDGGSFILGNFTGMTINRPILLAQLSTGTIQLSAEL